MYDSRIIISKCKYKYELLRTTFDKKKKKIENEFVSRMAAVITMAAYGS